MPVCLSIRGLLFADPSRVGWSPRISTTLPGFELSAPFAFSDTTPTCPRVPQTPPNVSPKSDSTSTWKTKRRESEVARGGAL